VEKRQFALFGFGVVWQRAAGIAVNVNVNGKWMKYWNWFGFSLDCMSGHNGQLISLQVRKLK
jgi:hypothetical protein